MRKFQVNTKRRMAMGLTQAEVGAKASVTGSTIARYENGYELTEVVVRSIEWAYDELFRALPKTEQAKVRIASNALLLLEATTYVDKVDCLDTILINSGFVLQDETANMRFGQKND